MLIKRELTEPLWTKSKSTKVNNVEVSGWFDNEYIYFGITSTEINNLVRKAKKESPISVLEDDRIEVSFSSKEMEKIYRIFINSEGVNYSVIQEGNKQNNWQNKIEYKTKIDKEKKVWTTEIAIPITSLKGIIEKNVPIYCYIIRDGPNIKFNEKEWTNLKFIDKNENETKLSAIIKKKIEIPKEKIDRALRINSLMKEMAEMQPGIPNRDVVLEEQDLIERLLKSSDKNEFEKLVSEKYGKEGLTKKFLPSPRWNDPSKYEKSVSEMNENDYLEYKKQIVDMFDSISDDELNPQAPEEPEDIY
jgi:hypothetical protein